MAAAEGARSRFPRPTPRSLLVVPVEKIVTGGMPDVFGHGRRQGVTQARLSFACTVALRSPREQVALEMLAVHLDETTGNLIRQLRGASYGAAAAVERRRGDIGELVLNMDLDAAAVPAALQAIHQLWTDLPTGVTARSVLQARRGVASGAVAAMLTSPSLAQGIFDRWVAGLDPRVANPVMLLPDIQSRDLEDMARRCWQRAGLGVVGDLETTRRALPAGWQLESLE